MFFIVKIRNSILPQGACPYDTSKTIFDFSVILSLCNIDTVTRVFVLHGQACVVATFIVCGGVVVGWSSFGGWPCPYDTGMGAHVTQTTISVILFFFAIVLSSSSQGCLSLFGILIILNLVSSFSKSLKISGASFEYHLFSDTTYYSIPSTHFCF